MATKIKICGITTVADAVAIGQIGVDAVGLMFYPPSPRCLSTADAAAISNALPPFTTRVAVFADSNENTVNTILSHCHIDVIQFHGDEPATFCRHFGKPYIKSVAMRTRDDLCAAATAYPDAAALLCDSYQPVVKGGAGEAFDWTLLGHDNRPDVPLILAGGLTPTNVGDAVKRVRPYAVDLSSGVESSKGKKDINAIAAVVAAVRLADMA